MKSFGKTKVAKPAILEKIIEIINRYDVILLQEIRNQDLQAIKKLHRALNKKGPFHYRYVISEPEGRSHYKEQYVYFFKKNSFKKYHSIVYPDPQDLFERNPFLLYLKPKNGQRDFFIIGSHIKPHDAAQEIKELEKVYDFGKFYFKEKEAIIMGDLNADCSYMNEDELDSAFFNNNPNFVNTISRSVDTTTMASTDCAYDRIIITRNIYSTLKKESAKTFNFLNWWDLSEEQALQISDHFPVEITLYL
jgi:endonuclease/exonuclease/phosphatase family metal-dependent hydrolase